MSQHCTSFAYMQISPTITFFSTNKSSNRAETLAKYSNAPNIQIESIRGHVTDIGRPIYDVAASSNVTRDEKRPINSKCSDKVEHTESLSAGRKTKMFVTWTPMWSRGLIKWPSPAHLLPPPLPCQQVNELKLRPQGLVGLLYAKHPRGLHFIHFFKKKKINLKVTQVPPEGLAEI